MGRNYFGPRGPLRKFIYAEVSTRDHARIKAAAEADDRSVTDFVRGCINDWLEDVGEQPLEFVTATRKGNGGEAMCVLWNGRGLVVRGDVAVSVVRA